MRDRRELQTEKVITICDHLIFLVALKKKGKIGWKALCLSLDCLAGARVIATFRRLEIGDTAGWKPNGT